MGYQSKIAEPRTLAHLHALLFNLQYNFIFNQSQITIYIVIHITLYFSSIYTLWLYFHFYATLSWDYSWSVCPFIIFFHSVWMFNSVLLHPWTCIQNHLHISFPYMRVHQETHQFYFSLCLCWRLSEPAAPQLAARRQWPEPGSDKSLMGAPQCCVLFSQSKSSSFLVTPTFHLVEIWPSWENVQKKWTPHISAFLYSALTLEQPSS